MTTPPALHPMLESFESNCPYPYMEAGFSSEERAYHQALETFLNHPPETEAAARAEGEALVASAEATGDGQLVLAAYIAWFQGYWYVATTSDLQHLVHAIQDLATVELPPLLEALVVQVQYLWAHVRQRKALNLYLIKKCIRCAPPETDIWFSAIQQYAMRMGELGRLQDMKPLLEGYRGMFGDGHPNLDRPLFSNACYNGELTNAFSLLPQMRSLHTADKTLGVYATYRTLLALMRTHVGVDAPPPPFSYEEDRAFCRNAIDLDSDTLLMTTRHLLAGNTGAALESARTYAAALGEEFFYLSRFDGDDMIRAELAAGNRDSALLLLQKRFRCGIHVWMNDFHGARIALLYGKLPLAESMFQSCLSAALHYGAENRLRFELCLSCEIPPATLFRWRDQIQADEDSPLSVPMTSDHATPVPSPATPSPIASTHPDQSAQPDWSPPTKPHPRKDGGDPLIGIGDAIEKLRANIHAFAKVTPPVLLTGETGVGKELVARRIHETGPRRKRPFVAVNCAALSSALLQSELFGHVRGAFTGATGHRAGLFETAADGTLLLDEVGDLAPEVQGALLRVLETGEFRPVGADVVHRSQCRILAATHRELTELVEAGRFRQDLYYRLSRLEIRIPPLRERREDILPLAMHFLRQDHPRPHACRISEELQRAFRAYPWTGNVRELKGAIEMLCLLYGNCDLYTEHEMQMANPRWLGVPESPPPPVRLPDPSPLPPLIVSHQASPSTPDAEERQKGNHLAARHSEGISNGTISEHPLDRLDRLDAFVRQQKRVTCKQVAHLFHVSPPTATRMLRDLIDKGLVRKRMPTRSPRTHYFELIEEA